MYINHKYIGGIYSISVDYVYWNIHKYTHSMYIYISINVYLFCTKRIIMHMAALHGPHKLCSNNFYANAIVKINIYVQLI